MTDPVAVLLGEKGHQVFSVSPEASVYEAIEMMSQRGIGALMVMQGSHLVGVLSERDYARRVILEGRSSRETRVEEIMSIAPVTVTPDHTVEECMRLMTEHHVRHLPVIDGGRMAGVLSIGDLVKRIISVQAQVIEYMENYINGSYPA